MALAAVGTRPTPETSSSTSRSFCPRRLREVQLTLHPLDGGGGWKFQVHSRPYGERDADWSLNAEGTVVAGLGDDTEEPTTEDDPIDETIERLNRMRPQELFETFADLELAWGPNWSGSPEVAVAR